MEQKLLTFEDAMEMMAQMSEEEKRQAMEEKSKICESFCVGCPSYVGTGEEKLLFCANGNSEIIEDEKGCMCVEGCTVQKDMGLRWSYYCTRGPGTEQLERFK